jgi:hypothetical protein
MGRVRNNFFTHMRRLAGKCRKVKAVRDIRTAAFFLKIKGIVIKAYQ